MIFNFNSIPRATPFMKMIIANNQNNNDNNDNNSKELSKELLLYKKNIDEYNIISLGCNCWPSTVIKELGLRSVLRREIRNYPFLFFMS
jgi:endo-1,4-beta-mannosidase